MLKRKRISDYGSISKRFDVANLEHALLLNVFSGHDKLSSQESQ